MIQGEFVHQKPEVTLFTDASVREGRSGWGGWAITDGKPSLKHSGECFSLNNNVAELEAIFYMLRHIVTTEYAILDVPMVIQSDSLYALSLLLSCFGNTYPAKVQTAMDSTIPMLVNKPKDNIGDILQQIWELVRHSPIVYLKHVKGHKSGSKRGNINHMVDRLAGSHTKGQPIKKKKTIKTIRRSRVRMKK